MNPNKMGRDGPTGVPPIRGATFRTTFRSPRHKSRPRRKSRVARSDEFLTPGRQRDGERGDKQISGMFLNTATEGEANAIGRKARKRRRSDRPRSTRISEQLKRKIESPESSPRPMRRTRSSSRASSKESQEGMVTIDIDGGHDEVPSNLLEVPDTGKSGIDGETISEGRKKTQDDKEDEAPSQPLEVPHTELGAIEKRSPSTRSERRRNSAARKRSKGGGSKKRKRDRTARRK